MALGKKIFVLDRCYNLCDFENYSPKSEIIGSIKRTGSGKLPCISDYADFLNQVMAFKKANFSPLVLKLI